MIKNWLEENNILFTELSRNNIEIQGLGNCLVVSEKDITLDESLTLILDEQEELQKPDNYIFKWGDNYYYSPTIKVKQFDILKYVGKFDDKIGITNYQFLGVHGGYEILNGSRSYKDWVKKAKFIGVRTLGICEKNTLAGTIKFQLECENGQINSIIGEEVTVKDGQEFYQIKLFVKNSKGWKDLLYINYEINVLNPGKYIELIKLHNFLSHGNLIIIFDPKYITLDQTLGFQLQQDSIDLYYQIDTVIYENEEREEWYLNNLKGFITCEHFKPILLSDAYYLDKEDFEAKQILNSISNLRDYKSNNQYFKNLYEEFEILNPLFKDEDKFFEIFQESIENLAEIEDKCIRFKIQTKVWHLPIYKQNEEQLKQYKGNNKDLFLDLISDGLKRKSPEGKFEEYKARLEKEYPVIVNNGFIDYFLILWDIVKWAKSQGILTGVARGCFIPGNKVKMADKSYKNIEEIKVGEEIFNYFYGKSKIEELFEYSVNEELIELEFEENKIICTKDHEFFTKNRGWVKAVELTNEDDIASGVRQNGFVRDCKRYGFNEDEYLKLLGGYFNYDDAINFINNGFNSKRNFKDYCENCGELYYKSVNGLRSNIYKLNQCPKCINKSTSNLPEKLIKNSKAQLIAQNKPEQKLKNKLNAKKYWSKESSRKNVSKVIRDLYANDPNHIEKITIGLKNSGRVLTNRFGWIKFDGLLELSYIIGCDNDKNVKTFKRYDLKPIKYFIDGDNYFHSYFPDFIVNGIIIEVKREFNNLLEEAKENLKYKIKAAKNKFGDKFEILFADKINYPYQKRKFCSRYNYKIEFNNEVKK